MLLGVGVLTLWAQSPEWVVRERWLLPEGDTLVVERRPQEWWVGVGVGSSGIGYLGRLRLPRVVETPDRGLLEFRYGSGTGVGFWIHAEWNPPGQRWGALLQVVPWESWTGRASFEPAGSLMGERYEMELHSTSALVTASARYAPGWGKGTLWEGLHFLAGIDARFLWNARERVRTLFRNTERVEEWRLQQEQPLPMWLGFHCGVGLDLVVALLGEHMRNAVTPVVLLQTGLPLQRTWGSSWTPVALRAGLSFKLGWERLQTVRLPRGAEGAVELAHEAGLSREVPAERLTPQPLAVVGTPVVPQAPAELSLGPRPASGPAITIVPNRVMRFSYPTPTAVGVTAELQRYLDALVDYLRTNPQAEVRIIGHTDEFGGTLEETQRISEERAQQVVEYLVQRGISRSRLLASGVGARQPIADNRTLQGRLQNRRVDIIVVQ